MKPAPIRDSNWRRAVRLLAAVAVLYQGLIPAGYMLGGRTDLAAGAFVVPCPVQQPGLAQVSAQHHHHHHHAGAGPAAPAGFKLHHADSCAFAVAAAAALPTAAIAAPVPQSAPREAPVRTGALAPPARAPLPPPARGPPALS